MKKGIQTTSRRLSKSGILIATVFLFALSSQIARTAGASNRLPIEIETLTVGLACVDNGLLGALSLSKDQCNEIGRAAYELCLNDLYPIVSYLAVKDVEGESYEESKSRKLPAIKAIYHCVRANMMLNPSLRVSGHTQQEGAISNGAPSHTSFDLDKIKERVNALSQDGIEDLISIVRDSEFEYLQIHTDVEGGLATGIKQGQSFSGNQFPSDLHSIVLSTLSEQNLYGVGLIRGVISIDVTAVGEKFGISVHNLPFSALPSCGSVTDFAGEGSCRLEEVQIKNTVVTWIREDE